MNTLITQQLLERLASLLRSESRRLLVEFGLLPVQFEALHYLSICNRYSDTPMAVTEFLGQTKGTVSQTLKVLEKKKLLEKTADLKDKRVTRLVLTKAGRDLVKKLLPSPILSSACELMGDEALQATNSSLSSLLFYLQSANNFKTFGQCDTCQHNIKNDSNEYLCGLTKEPLTTREITLRCREHQPIKHMQPDKTNTVYD
ncbi:MAG: MarR family winged helix-turn-helix transcriptional regulator [Xanthomonadales bacterium]|nr:MarR family winged helix-turn-helix transcriptional regulator [Xanthomonadales bacterium]